MTFYTQPEDEVLLDLQLDREESEELRAYLESQHLVESTKERGMVFDSAFDPHAVVEAIRHSQLAIKVVKEVLAVGKEAAIGTVAGILSTWVINRNHKKKAGIDAKTVEPLLLDQYGRRLDLRPENKKKRRK